MGTVVALTAVGLDACSASDDSGVKDPAPGARPATPASGEAGDDATPSADGDPGIDVNQPPQSCAFLEGDSGRGPVFEPAACKACVAQRCCVQLTKCFGGAAADAGLDGSSGPRTACQLFGECEVICQGSGVCEAQCTANYGEAAAADWEAYDGCISGSSPVGCQDVCP
jgi:hypothetical protein